MRWFLDSSVRENDQLEANPAQLFASKAVSDNRGRWTSYWLDEREARGGRQASLFDPRVGTESVATAKSQAPPRSGGDLPRSGGDLPRSGGDLPRSGGDLPRSGGDLPRSGGDLPRSGDALPHDHDLAALESIAQPVAKAARAKPGVVRRTILTLCRGRYLTAEQLGGLLRRNPDGLRDRYLTDMIKKGDLELRFPGSASRPDQAYTTSRRATEP